MAIEDGSMGVRTILSSPYRHTARLRPSRLDAFATHTSRAFGEVNVVFDLTLLPMAREVELRDDDLPIIQGRDGECRRS